MKKYIIHEDTLSKVKALLKVGKVKNVVIEYKELNNVLKALESLEETKGGRPKKKFYYDIYFTGVSPVTDILHEKNVLIMSKLELSMDQVEQMIWQKFKYVRISAKIDTITKGQFQYLNQYQLLSSQG